MTFCMKHRQGRVMIYDQYVWDKKTKMWKGPRGCVYKGRRYVWVHQPHLPPFAPFQTGEEDSWEMAVYRAEYGSEDLDHIPGDVVG